MNMLPDSGNRLLVFGCERSVSDTHRNSAAEGGGPAVAPEVTDGTGLARARQRFLAAQPLEPGQVRDTILASWQRSRRWNVAAGHIDPCYVRDPGPGTPLTRSALPVLQTPRRKTRQHRQRPGIPARAPTGLSWHAILNATATG